MTIQNRNFLELCNDVLSELYYETVDNFNELEEREEGRRVKRELNKALTFICNNEDGIWSFRDTITPLMAVEGIKNYDKPNGFIQYIKYPKSNLILTYIDEHKYVPSYATGMPVSYWMFGETIRLFPIPDRTYQDNIMEIHHLTYDYAKDCCGIGKPVMEYETDVPIIPNNHRDILIYKVCMDWRANLSDAKTQFYRAQYSQAYKALLNDCRETYDLENGLHIEGYSPSYKDQLLDIMNNPYTIPRPQKGNN